LADYDPDLMPRLRPVEAKAVDMDGKLGFALTDPTGLAESSIMVSEAALFVLSKFDGRHRLAAIREDFERRFHQEIGTSTLADMVDGLRKARLLGGDEFERYYASLVEAYRSGPTRMMHAAGELGLDKNPEEIIQGILTVSPSVTVPGKVLGIVAPHLDYPRGAPCYSAAYSALLNRPAPERIVILGTNHFGQASSTVVTGKDFETPLGTTPCDREFIDRLELCCGDLRAHELDHQREHSVELQLLFCQHIWGAEAFKMVPVLCPDPCGPTGTAPLQGQGVDLREFAEAVREVIEDDPEDTLVIAGADLSHVGPYFGDERELDEAYLAEVHDRDALALTRLEANDPDGFLRQVAEDDNPTHVCSAGCVFAAMVVLRHAKVTVMKYHQAVEKSAQNGVTCAAAVFTA
jgi:AmmeMemoRadiSam system protein B